MFLWQSSRDRDNCFGRRFKRWKLGPSAELGFDAPPYRWPYLGSQLVGCRIFHIVSPEAIFEVAVGSGIQTFLMHFVRFTL
jgi:hypothetical protein